MHSTIDAQSPQKVPKQKTCQTPRKLVISDYPLLNCITARKCEILYSITTKMTCIIKKLTKIYISDKVWQVFCLGTFSVVIEHLWYYALSTLVPEVYFY
jgi:hypothetical protein